MDTLQIALRKTTMYFVSLCFALCMFVFSFYASIKLKWQRIWPDLSISSLRLPHFILALNFAENTNGFST